MTNRGQHQRIVERLEAVQRRLGNSSDPNVKRGAGELGRVVQDLKKQPTPKQSKTE